MRPDLDNQTLEIILEDEAICIVRYLLPAGAQSDDAAAASSAGVYIGG